MLEALYFAPLRREAETQTQPTQAATQVDTQDDTSAYVHQPSPPSVEEALQAGRPRFDLALDKATDWRCTFDAALAAVDAVAALLAAHTEPKPPPHNPCLPLAMQPVAPIRPPAPSVESLVTQRVSPQQGEGTLIRLHGLTLGYYGDEHLAGKALTAVGRAMGIGLRGYAAELAEHTAGVIRAERGLRDDQPLPDRTQGNAAPTAVPIEAVNVAANASRRGRAKGEPAEAADAPQAEMTQVELMREAYNLRASGCGTDDIVAALRLSGPDPEAYAEALIQAHVAGASAVELPNDFSWGARRR